MNWYECEALLHAVAKFFFIIIIIISAYVNGHGWGVVVELLNCRTVVI